jgi:hypothetical protein
MTAGVRRGPRRRKPHHLSYQLAAVRRHRGTNLGPISFNLLGQVGF